MEGLADKVKILVNRVGLENGQITLKKAEETIGKEIFWQFPNDYRTMIEARNNGVPLIEMPEGRDYPIDDGVGEISLRRCEAAKRRCGQKRRIRRAFQTLAEQNRKVVGATLVRLVAVGLSVDYTPFHAWQPFTGRSRRTPFVVMA